MRSIHPKKLTTITSINNEMYNNYFSTPPHKNKIKKKLIRSEEIHRKKNEFGKINVKKKYESFSNKNKKCSFLFNNRKKKRIKINEKRKKGKLPDIKKYNQIENQFLSEKSKKKNNKKEKKNKVISVDKKVLIQKLVVSNQQNKNLSFENIKLRKENEKLILLNKKLKEENDRFSKIIQNINNDKKIAESKLSSNTSVAINLNKKMSNLRSQLDKFKRSHSYFLFKTQEKEREKF